MALPDSFIQELKYKSDIEDIVSTYVTLRRRGSTYVGLCPFHNEKTPSFTVYPETQSFYCFGCGAGGDTIGFIKRIENLDYIDAVKSLAQRVGVQMPEDGFDDTLAKKRRRILAMNREAARFYHSYMMSEDGKVGLNYYISRGLTRKTITKFGLGYAPNEWSQLRNHLKSLGYSYSEMAEAGLIKRTDKGGYDLFRNRVMTPVIDIRGNVIAFSGRVLDDSKPKYVNSPETLVYKKTNELFALNLAKDSGSDKLILCEGQMDVIAMHQAGFTNAVAGCGTAITNEQVRLISRYAKEVILCYDTDEAGRKALDKAINLFKNTDIKIRIPALSGGKDPDEIIKNQGKERFAAMLDSSANDIEYAILNIRSKYDLNVTKDQVDFLNDIVKLLSNATKIEQELYISRICEELKIEKSSIYAQLRQYERRNKYTQRRRIYESEFQKAQREDARESYEKSATTRKIKAENRMISLLIKYPKCAKLCETFDENMISEGFNRKVFSLTIKFINDGVDADVSQYSQYLSDSEISELSRIINVFNDSGDYTAEFTDCMKTVEEEYKKKDKIDAGSMSDVEFEALMKKLANKKKIHNEEEN